MERPDCRHGIRTTKPKKNQPRNTPNPPYRSIWARHPINPSQKHRNKKDKYKKKQKKKTGGTPHTTPTQRKGEVKNKMEWEETDTLVHFYQDQDRNLYMKLPGTSLWKVRKERQEKLRKALKEIGYQPIPIQTTQNPRENITKLLQEGGPRRLPLPSGAVITIYTENQELKATLIEEGITTELRGPKEILEIIIHHSEGGE